MTYAGRSHLYILLEAIRENLRGAPDTLFLSVFSSPLPPLLLFIHTSISSPYFSILLVPRLEPPLFPRQHRIRSKFSYILFTAFLLILLPSEEYSRGNLFNRPRVTYVSLIQIIQNTRHRRKIRIFNEKLEVRQSRCSGINEKLTEQSAPPTDYFS